MKKYRVEITSEAEEDIKEIFDYIEKHDNTQNAEYVLGQLEQIILGLEKNPERGTYPNELSRHGIKDFREVFFKPYRAIYEVAGNKVIVHVCVDGRRDMRSLLAKRLLRYSP